MTIPGRSFDGWPIDKSYQVEPVPLVRSPKMGDIPAIYDEQPTPQGLDLYQHIIWGLERSGIVMTEERAEKIRRACLE